MGDVGDFPVAVRDCAVGFIDVLGTRAAIASMGLREVARLLISPFMDADAGARDHLSFAPGLLEAEDFEPSKWGFTRLDFGLQGLLIGDSLILVCAPNDATIKPGDAIWHVGEYIAGIAQRASERGVFVRGAIAYGEMLLGLGEAQICVGLPLQEAVLLEARQLWSGVMLAPSAQDAVLAAWAEAPETYRAELASEGLADVFESPQCLVRWYPVPIRSDSGEATVVRALVVNIVSPGLSGFASVLRNRFRLPDIADDLPEDAKLKLANTIAFANFVQRKP
jgi:hypothetical protein